MRTSVLSLALLVFVMVRANAQKASPWITALSMSRPAVGVGECNVVNLDLKSGTSAEWPRGPNGSRVSMADFDFSVTAPTAHAAVGKYDGPRNFAVCACPKASPGTVATVTARYPSQTIAPKAKMEGVSFTTSMSAPIIAGASGGNPPGCDEAGATTTVWTGKAKPWVVTVQPPALLPIGTCGAVVLTLRDSTGKDWPRTAAGSRVSVMDFDLSASAGNGAHVISRSNGGGGYVACACQAGKVGEAATVTATYPAAALPEKAGVTGVTLTATAPFTLAAARSSAEPEGCGAAQPQLARSTSNAPPIAARSPTAPVSPQPLPSLAPGTRSGATPMPTAIAKNIMVRDIPTLTGGPDVPLVAGPTMNSAKMQNGIDRSTHPRGTLAPPTLVDQAHSVRVVVDQRPEEDGSAYHVEVTRIRVYRSEASQPTSVQLHGAFCLHTPYDSSSDYCQTLGFDDPIPAGSNRTPAYIVVNEYSDGYLLQSPPAVWVPPKVANPTRLIARDLGGDSALLQWEPVPRAVRYLIAGSGLPDTGLVIEAVNSTMTTTLTKLPGGQDTWHVTAMFAGNAADFTTPAAASLFKHAVPTHTVAWLSKPYGTGSAQSALDQGAYRCAEDQNRWCQVTFYLISRLVPLLARPDGYYPFYEAVYGNTTDLGFGRRTSCAFGMAPPPGFFTTVCYTSSHGPGPGEAGFADPDVITKAASEKSQQRAISVVISDSTGMRFLVFRPSNYGAEMQGNNTPIATIKFDTEGDKFAPHSCLACHGGRYDPNLKRVLGATMLPLDPSQLAFAGGNSGRAAQEESIRRVNERVQAASSNPVVKAYINGLYGGIVTLPGAKAVDNFVPAGWQSQVGLYQKVVRPYCTTCHMAAQPTYSFATWGNFQSNASAIHAAVCEAHSMPHAEIPFTQFWMKDTGALFLPGLLATALGYPKC